MKKVFAILLVLFACTGGFFSNPVHADNEELPSWFFTPTGAIGVSDMNMEETAAVNQAIVRALFLQAMSEGIEISSVYELYYHMEYGRKNSIDNQKSHCIVEFETKLSDYDYDVADVFYTHYNEAVVSLNIYHNRDDGEVKSATFKGSYMFYFDGTINSPEFGDWLVVEMETPGEEIKTMEWNSRTEMNSTTVYSIVDEDNKKVLDKYNYYANSGEPLYEAVFQNTRHGLWNCLVDTYVQSITNFIPEEALISSTNRTVTNMQNVNDDADFNDIVQDLARITYRTKTYCDINRISFTNGYVYVDWSCIEAGLPQDEKEYKGQTFDCEIEGYQAVAGTDYSKARNEARRIAIICAENEIAKMVKYKASSTIVDFSLSENDESYSKHVDTSHISTVFFMRGVQQIQMEEPKYNDGIYCSKMKTIVGKDNVVPLKK